MPTSLSLFSHLMFTKLEGAVTSGMIHLGDALGLYSALKDAPGPLTSSELAEHTGLDERWVLEPRLPRPDRAPRPRRAHESTRGGHHPQLITTFDCIHDMTRPLDMMQSLRRAIAPDGTWLLVDTTADETFELNATRNPMASL